MNDSISRAAALDVVEKMYKMCEGNLSDYHDLLVACFTDLTPAVRWIPCKELLPSDYQWYYATCKSLVDNRENWVVEGCYTPWEHFNSTPMIKCGEAEVIAWMPKEFPEPYQEKE